MFLYLGPDLVGATGASTGIGKAMWHELLALQQLGPTVAVAHKLWPNLVDQDNELLAAVKELAEKHGPPQLAHVFSGCYSRTMGYLHMLGCKLTYSSVGHDPALAQQEWQRLRWVAPAYERSTPKELEDIEKRIAFVHAAAAIVFCASEHSQNIAERYAVCKTVWIPHGCELAEAQPLPDRFTVGFLGSPYPEKGLLYLLQAWDKLDYADATLKLTGFNMQSLSFWKLARQFDRRELIELHDWTPDIAGFFSSISLYVQPSVTEASGLPVLEAMAHGRAVLCSTGAGAVDVVPEAWRFPARDVDTLASKIDFFRKQDLSQMGHLGQAIATKYTWEKFRERYLEVWRTLL